MASVEDLPADLREQVVPAVALGSSAPRQKPGGGTFIGGKAREYAASPAAPPTPPEVPDDLKVGPAEEKKPAAPCPRCTKEMGEGANFCAACGLDLKRRRAADELGVAITDDEIDDYLFKGHIVKAVPLFGKHVATFKSVQAGEVDQADQITTKYFEEKKPTDLEWINYRSKVLISFGWMKLDGKPLGDSPEKRLAWIQNAGNHLVELAGKKLQLLNGAIAELLNGDLLRKS
jgi:hypothetical protein